MITANPYGMYLDQFSCGLRGLHEAHSSRALYNSINGEYTKNQAIKPLIDYTDKMRQFQALVPADSSQKKYVASSTPIDQYKPVEEKNKYAIN